MFRSDAQTGWSNAPNLLTTRINAAGEEWSIRTDESGQRLVVQNPRAKRRILILGDSLSFGEGVDINDRFDVKMLSSLRGARVVNTVNGDNDHQFQRHLRRQCPTSWAVQPPLGQ
jgi:hypothetical protein